MPTSLSDNQIQRIASAVEAGRRPRVYFTADAVGMEEGRSGMVVAVAARTEPDFLHVRPTGSNDTLAFSPTELTVVRPADRHTPARRPRAAAETPSLLDDLEKNGSVGSPP
ncbi:hypothetical protein AB0H76_19740 [Nocardia sp. NPDC050712]|uniref:hypothetical protein n=1 Tax=Nocardia sp. NPDC050712 TaxID=3155518 RepID=UPI0033DA88CF